MIIKIHWNDGTIEEKEFDNYIQASSFFFSLKSYIKLNKAEFNSMVYYGNNRK